MRNRTFKALAAALVAAALVAAPLVTAGASAEETQLQGEVGKLVPFTPESNDAGYWENQTEHESKCYKVDAPESSSHGTISADKKTITLKPYEEDWWGDHWELLVIKAGNTNNVINHPEAGVAYASPENGGGNQADVSHWIVCKGEYPTEKPKDKVTETEESTTDCGDEVVVTVTTITTTPYKWDAEAEEWVLDEANAKTEEKRETRELTEEEWADCNPTTTKTTYGEWVDGEWECGDTTVTQTREVYTTVYHGEDAEPTVTTTETQTRELTAEESEQDCTPTPTPTPTVTPADPGGTPTSTDSEALAATGGGISPMFAVAGGAVLFAGVSAVAFAAYRRRQGAAE
ncbi:hypothetical protein ACWKWN_19570 [Microbacterium trichothecenolyticum]